MVDSWLGPLLTMIICAGAVGVIYSRRVEMWTGYHQHFLRNPQIYRRIPSLGQLKAAIWMVTAGFALLWLISALALVALLLE